MTRPRPRDLLLRRVLVHYAENGVRDTSLRTLAGQIGTSQRMLSYHFGSRQRLLTAVLAAVAEADAALLDRLTAETTDPVAAMAELWPVVADHAETYGALFFEVASHAMYGREETGEVADRLGRQTETTLAEAFRTVADDGTAATLARLTVATGRGLVFQMLLDGDRAASDAAFERYLAGIRRQLTTDETAPEPSA